MSVLAAGAPGSGFVISGWLGLALAVVGAAGMAGFAYVYFKSTVSKTAIENYKSAYDSMHVRVDEMELSVADAKAHADRCDAELAAQKNAYELLADQVRGTSQIQELGAKLDAQLGTLNDGVKQMAKDLNEGQDHMAEALGSLVVDLRHKFGLDDMDRRA